MVTSRFLSMSSWCFSICAAACATSALSRLTRSDIWALGCVLYEMWQPQVAHVRVTVVSAAVGAELGNKGSSRVPCEKGVC